MSLKFAEDCVNLTEIAFLLADPSDLYRELFRQLLHGFGVRKVHDAATATVARRILADKAPDFLICSADLPTGGGRRVAGSGIEFVRSIRLDRDNPQRSIPIMITMGTARRITVGQARDSGANFVLSKPIAPVVLYDRINWIARRPRPFWDSPSYFGPDRRFREVTYEGAPQRRETDRAQDGSTDDNPQNGETEYAG